MLTVSNGYDVAYLTDAVGAFGADYYLSASAGGGEPPGFWTGKGADVLGLTGNVDAATIKALYHAGRTPAGTVIGSKPRDYSQMKADLEKRVAEAVAASGPYATAQQKADIRNAELGKLRSALLFVDFTYSATKSVSLAHAGYLSAAKRLREAGDETAAQTAQDMADLIESAMRQTARDIVAALERRGAYTRTGHHGKGGDGQWRDAAGLTAAAFLQHTSRDGDPQLHVHIAVLNKVQRADGADDTYRALDQPALRRQRLRVAALADRILTARLTAAGFPMLHRPDGNGFEVGGIAQPTIDAFSARRAAITPEIARLVDAYRAKHGRDPSRQAVWSMRQHATLTTRQHKPEVVRPAAEELAAWEEKSRAAEVQALTEIPGAIRAYAAGRPAPAALDPQIRTAAIQAAVAAVQRENATWTVEQLTWELGRVVPNLPPMDAAGITALFDGMVADAISGKVPGAEAVQVSPAPDPVDLGPLGTRASDGMPVHSPPGEGRFVTAAHLDTEDFLIRQAARRVRQAVTDDQAAEALAGRGLTRDQHPAALALLTSTRAVDVFVGPAGTGKTFTIAAFSHAWRAATGGAVVGLASSTDAARVMAGEGFTRTHNLADWLGAQHPGTQLPVTGDRCGCQHNGTRGHRPVRPGDVLVIDEASQLATSDLAHVMQAAAVHGARVVLTGDHAQLSSPEAAGAMRMLAKAHGQIELGEVLRFAEAWEGPASLRLRDGDKTALDQYERHGRIYEGTAREMHAAAVKQWLAAHVAGRADLMIAPSNAEAATLAREARAELIRLGRVDAKAQVTLADENEASVGDLVRAGENRKDINAGGQTLANRDVLRLDGFTGTGDNRTARVSRRTSPGTFTEPFTVPVAYLREHGELAYAGNVHVAQGQTVTAGQAIIDETTSRENLYVAATRAVEGMRLFVVTARDDVKAEDGRNLAREQVTGRAILETVLDRESDAQSAHEVIERAQAAADSLPRLHGIWASLAREATAAQVDGALLGLLSGDDYLRYSTDPERDVLQRVLRGAQMAGADVAEILTRATRRDMGAARSVAAVLYGRVTKMDLPAPDPRASYATRTPEHPRPERAQVARQLAEILDAQIAARGEVAAAVQPEWAVKHLGPVPDYIRPEPEHAAGPAAATAEAQADPQPAVEVSDPAAAEAEAQAPAPRLDADAGAHARAEASEAAQVGDPKTAAEADSVSAGASREQEHYENPAAGQRARKAEIAAAIESDAEPKPVPEAAASAPSAAEAAPLAAVPAAAGTAEAQAAASPQVSDPAHRTIPAAAERILTPREQWVADAGTVAAARELTSHDHPEIPLGDPPHISDAERRYAWQAAAHALKMPDADLDLRQAEAGELQAGILAYERDLEWAPAHVAPDLATTARAETDAKADAAITWAQAESDPAQIPAAGGFDNLAADLGERRAQLEEIDAAYQQWHDDTAQARAVATANTRELERRAATGTPLPPQPRTPDAGDPEPGPQPAREPLQISNSPEAVARANEVIAEALAAIERQAELERDHGGLTPESRQIIEWFREPEPTAAPEARQEPAADAPAAAATATAAPEAIAAEAPDPEAEAADAAAEASKLMAPLWAQIDARIAAKAAEAGVRNPAPTSAGPSAPPPPERKPLTINLDDAAAVARAHAVVAEALAAEAAAGRPVPVLPAPSAGEPVPATAATQPEPEPADVPEPMDVPEPEPADVPEPMDVPEPRAEAEADRPETTPQAPVVDAGAKAPEPARSPLRINLGDAEAVARANAVVAEVLAAEAAAGRPVPVVPAVSVLEQEPLEQEPSASEPDLAAEAERSYNSGASIEGPAGPEHAGAPEPAANVPEARPEAIEPGPEPSAAEAEPDTAAPGGGAEDMPAVDLDAELTRARDAVDRMTERNAAEAEQRAAADAAQADYVMASHWQAVAEAQASGAEPGSPWTGAEVDTGAGLEAE